MVRSSTQSLNNPLPHFSRETMQVYYYPGCATCRKALKWLDANNVTVERIHIVEATPDVATLRRLWERSGLPLRRFFNTSGKSYRDGGFKDRLKTMTDDEALEVLAADGMLIKRPILVSETHVLVGFKPDAWATVTHPMVAAVSPAQTQLSGPNDPPAGGAAIGQA